MTSAAKQVLFKSLQVALLHLVTKADWQVEEVMSKLLDAVVGNDFAMRLDSIQDLCSKGSVESLRCSEA